jgi:formylglycine-generating enzyme required for sulfatase activity
MSDASPRSFQVFISYSTKDKQPADAACALLERNGVRCWIAPRNILPGSEWGASIIAGLDACKIMVLIFSGHANASAQVRREVERAISKRLTIIPCRVENVAPTGAMEYALGNTHWLDAFSQPVEQQMEALAPVVLTLLGVSAISEAVPRSTGAAHGRSTQSGRHLPLTKGDSPAVAELRLSLPGRVTMEMVRIGAGNFLMGSSEEQGKDDERPQHGVQISRDFYLGKFPVTQEQYQAVMGSNPSRFTLTERHPVDNVSWIEAREFCRRLQAFLQCQPPPNPLRAPIASIGLPTEAEWEYACRAGTQTLFSFGDNLKDLPEYGWFDRNSDKATQAVGQLKPNHWGLHEMHGNVWEWCEDSYAETYTNLASNDPRGPATGDRRVLRGGSWSCYSKQCRSACRHAAEPSAKTANYGLRALVRAAD